MIQNRKKLYTIIVIGAIILAGLIWGISMLWNIYITQKVVRLEPAKNTTITLGTQKGDTPAIDKEVIKTSTNLSKRLKPGNYVVIFGAEGYESQNQLINLNKNTTISTPELNYTTDRLKIVLNQDRANIQKVVNASAGNGYIISDESLYKQADWYVSILLPTDPSKDMLKIILKKEDNKWVVAAKPSIIFWIDDYPNIPEDVIRAVNKLGF
jgi:hypothetical protein